MAGFDRVLQLKLVTDVGNIDAQMAGVTSKIAGVGTALKTGLKLGAIGLASDAIGELMSAVGGGMQDARDTDAAMLNLSKTVANLGLDADAAMTKVGELGDQALSLGFDDTDAATAFDKFLTKTGSVEEAGKLVEDSFDLARSKAVDLGTAADELDSIYNGSSKVLKDYGVTGVQGMEAVDAAMVTSQGKAAAWAADSANQMAIVEGNAGELFETVGTTVTGAIDDVIVPAITDTLIPAIDGIWTTVQPGLQELADTLGPKLGEILGKLGELFTALQPTIQTALDLLMPIIDTFVANVGLALDLISQALDLVIAVLNGDFTGAWQALTGIVDTVIETIKNTVGGMAEFLLSLVEGVGAAANAVGNAILTGILGMLVGLADAIVAPVKQGLNAIVDIWNGLGIHIPEVVLFDQLGRRDTFGPIDLDLPDLPHLAAGGLVTRPMHALIGESGPEAVIPVGRLGAMGGGDTYNLTVNVPPTADPYAVGQAVVRAIGAFERRAGKHWRTRS